MQAIPEANREVHRHQSTYLAHHQQQQHQQVPSPHQHYQQQQQRQSSAFFATDNIPGGAGFSADSNSGRMGQFPVAGSSSMSGRYSDAGEFRGFGASSVEQYGSSSQSGRHHQPHHSYYPPHEADSHRAPLPQPQQQQQQQYDTHDLQRAPSIDRIPSQRAVAVPVPDNDDTRATVEATFGRNVRNEDVMMLEGMGFTINKILPALEMYGSNIEAAANYLAETQ